MSIASTGGKRECMRLRDGLWTASQSCMTPAGINDVQVPAGEVA
jgi:hypothetical protein